jgi:hypothetical protein
MRLGADRYRRASLLAVYVPTAYRSTHRARAFRKRPAARPLRAARRVPTYRGRIARLEVPVQTPLRFHTRTSGLFPADDLPTPETVVVEFESRELVWHAPGVSEPLGTELPREYTPTVTTVMQPGDEIEELFSLVLRFLSAVAFHFQTEAYAQGFGASGETDAMHPAVSRQAWGGLYSTAIQLAPRGLAVTDDDRLRLSLALYREGRSARSKYLAWMALWNVIQAVHDGDDKRVDQFLNTEASKVLNAPGGLNAFITSVLKAPHAANPPADVARYFRDHGRDAIAHVIRHTAAMPHINPDDLDDRFRLDADTYVLHALARRAIDQRWPNAVTTTALDDH